MKRIIATLIITINLNRLFLLNSIEYIYTHCVYFKHLNEKIKY